MKVVIAGVQGLEFQTFYLYLYFLCLQNTLALD